MDGPENFEFFIEVFVNEASGSKEGRGYFKIPTEGLWIAAVLVLRLPFIAMIKRRYSLREQLPNFPRGPPSRK